MSEMIHGQETELKRSLSLPLVIMYGLAYLAPTVVFNYYGLFTPSTDGMYALSLALTTLVMTFTALSYTRMVKAYPVAGSAYTYVNKAVQPHAGFMTGWMMLLDYMLVPMICYLLIGVYVNNFFPGVPVWATVVVLALAGMIINIVGIKTASVIDTIITIAVICFMIIFIVLVTKYVLNGGGSGKLLDGKAIFNPATFKVNNVLAATAVLCASFLGFDAVTTLAEETKNPDKIMGKAIIGVVIGAGAMFVVIAYFAQIAWPEAYQNIEDLNSGIFELFPRINPWIGNVFFIVDNFGSFVCAMAGMGAVSRILYGMGRDNILPKKFFGHLSNRFQTPVNNIVLTTVIALTAIFYSDNVFGAASLVAFGAVCGFFMVNLAVIFHYYIKLNKRKGFDICRYLIAPIIGMGSLVVVFIYMDSSAKVLGLVWMLIGLVYLAFKTKFFKELPPEMTLGE